MKTLRKLYDTNASFALAVTALAFLTYVTIVVLAIALLVAAFSG